MSEYEITDLPMGPTDSRRLVVLDLPHADLPVQLPGGEVVPMPAALLALATPLPYVSVAIMARGNVHTFPEWGVRATAFETSLAEHVRSVDGTSVNLYRHSNPAENRAAPHQYGPTPQAIEMMLFGPAFGATPAGSAQLCAALVHLGFTARPTLHEQERVDWNYLCRCVEHGHLSSSRFDEVVFLAYDQSSPLRVRAFRLPPA